MKKYKKYYFGTRIDYLVTQEIVFCDRGRNIYFDTGRYINEKNRKQIQIKISARPWLDQKLTKYQCENSTNSWIREQNHET